jgi:hypothetical protein
MDDDWAVELERQRQLGREGTTLGVPWRMVVVRVEAALANGNGAGGYELSNRVHIANRIEFRRIVRMNPGTEGDKPAVTRGDVRRSTGGLDRFSDTDDRDCSRQSSALDDILAVGIERWIGEMRVTVDEARH